MNESDVQKGLKDALRFKGMRVYHTQYSIGSVGIGFPDLIAIRVNESGESVLVAIETKGPNGRMRPYQQDWIDEFNVLPGCVFAGVVGPEPTDNWIGYDDALTYIMEQL